MDEAKPTPTTVSADPLGKLLLMQSVLDSLPDEKSIRSFVGRGLSEMPGVVAARICETPGELPEQDFLRFPLNLGEACKGELLLTCQDPAAFKPYEEYIKNFCFMLAVILEERQQRHFRESQQATLEKLVQERTRELQGEITERRQIEQQVRGLLAEAERGRSALIGILDDQKLAEEKVRHRTMELAALNSLTRGVTSSLSVEAVVASALQEMLNAVKTDLAFLFLREGERLVLGGIAPESGREQLGQIPEHRVGECLCGLAVRQGHPLYSQDIFSDLRCTWDECKKAGFHSFAALPLRAGDEIIGVIGLASGTERDFERQAKFLETLANAVSAGLQNSRLFAETKRTEAALRKSEERYRRITKCVPDLIWIMDLSGRYTFVNSAVERTHGWTAEEFLKLTFQDVGTPQQAAKDAALLEEEVARAASPQYDRNRILTFESEELHKNGSTFWAEVTAAFLWSDEGKPVGIIGVTRDVTERKRAAEALLESEEKFAKVFQNAPILIAITDLANATYLDVNAESLRVSGFTREEVIGRRAAELGWITVADRDRLLQELREKGRISGLEMTFQAKGGRQVQGLVKGEQISLGGRPCLLTVSLDITERKQLETNFLRAQRLEGLGALAGGIAHDLNNILQPILMLVPVLRETAGDAETREMLDSVETCAQRGADIIRQLLTFARGKPSARVPLPVRHLLNEVNKLIEETFPKNIHIMVTVPKDLWLVLGDATQIHQAIMNLCVNARDAMPNGGTLTLAAANLSLSESDAAREPGANPGPYTCVSVADTGTGIPPEYLDLIFDPFFTTKEIGKGTGLGLATVLGVVRGHGGFVRVASQVGKGTTIKLFLPASLEAPPADRAGDEPLPPRANGELILVVDDEASVRGAVGRTLEKHGYRVISAAEGAAAVKIFNQHRAEVRAVLTDLMMPGMDGLALVRALHQLEPQLPILGMTGVGDKAEVKGLETLDLPPLLTKPFGKTDLLGILHQTLANFHHRNNDQRST